MPGNRVDGDWRGPASFLYAPVIDPIYDDVLISMWIEPDHPVADGSTPVQVVAEVTTPDGHPVPDEQVRFVTGHYCQLPNGDVIGPTDPPPSTECLVLPSGRYDDQNGGGSNLFTTRTNQAGVATAEFVPPTWAEYMAEKPHELVVWYHVDGGGNPFVSTLFLWTEPD